MTAAEILSSESQERMCAVVAPENVDAFMAVCRRWDVTATVIGEVTDGDRLRITARRDGGRRPAAHRRPRRPGLRAAYARPDWQDALQADTSEGAAARRTRRAGRPGPARGRVAGELAARTWVTEQYDRYVRGNTTLAPPADAGVVRVDEASGRGVAVSIDANARFCQLDPRAGAQLALAESLRNVASSGAVPVAVTDCLNFGSPEDPAVMWQFAEAVRGLADACAELGHARDRRQRQLLQPDRERGDPADAGGRRARRPRRRRAPGAAGLGPEGDAVLLLGETRDELGGSAWARVVHDHLGGRPPAVDLAAEPRLAALMAAAGADGLLTGAHDLSDGGLAQALVEASLAGGRGARVTLPAAAGPVRRPVLRAGRPDARHRRPGGADAVAARARAGVPAERLGTTGGPALDIDGRRAGPGRAARRVGEHAARAVRWCPLAGKPLSGRPRVRKVAFGHDTGGRARGRR